MANRETPFGAFNFLVKIELPGADDQIKILGGFSDVSGLGHEVTIAEYRTGNEKELLPRKVANVHKVPDITLKRGVVDSINLWKWVNEYRNPDKSEEKKNVIITLRDEEKKAVLSWTLHSVIPMKYTGPTLAAKGGGDVAMEEMVLSVEKLDMKVL